MSTTGHETEAINVQGLKASLKKGGNIGLYNEAICSTAGGTAAKVTNTTPPSFTLTAGAKILVKFTYAISAENATLQVGSNTAKPIYYKGSALPADLVKAGTSLLLSYDGTSFNIVGDINTDTTYSVMGASGSTHSGGLVPDTPSEAGTTKFLREDGTWQEPAGQNYSAGDGIDITNGEISVDSTVALKTDLAPAKLGSGIGTCSTSSGTALEVVLSDYNLVQNGFVAVTFENDVPANATLNINGKGDKPIIYKGSAITADTIKADDTVMFCYDGTNYVVTSLGGGGAVSTKESVVIFLNTNQGSSSDADIIGATITVANANTGSVIFSGIWNGINIPIEVDNLINYTIQVGNVSNYATPESQTYQAKAGYIREVVLIYNTEIVTVTCTAEDSQSVAGQTVTINNTQYTLDSTGIITSKVAYGTSYSVVMSEWNTHRTPFPQTFTAGQATRSVSMEYKEFVIGVFIEGTDHELYTAAQWPSAGKVANSIFVGTSSIQLKLGLQMNLGCHSGISSIGSMTIISDETTAKNDFDGRTHTQEFIENGASTDSSYAIGYCVNYLFPDGSQGAYYPSMGELNVILQNRTNIKSCCDVCGSNLMPASGVKYEYGCSTLMTNQKLWGMNILTDGSVSTNTGIWFDSRPKVIPVKRA